MNNSGELIIICSVPLGKTADTPADMEATKTEAIAEDKDGSPATIAETTVTATAVVAAVTFAVSSAVAVAVTPWDSIFGLS
jgi:hypothetical protein